MDIGKKIIPLDTEIEFHAKLYDIPFDFQKALQLSKSSKEKSLTYKTSKGEEFVIFPILDIYYSKMKTIAIIILPNENCVIMGKKSIETRYRHVYTYDNELFDSLKSGNYLIATLEDAWIGGKKQLIPKIEKIALETDKKALMNLMRYIEKICFPSWGSNLNLEKIGNLVSISVLKEQQRNESLEKILISLNQQLTQLERAKKLEEVKFYYPSPNILQIILDTEGIIFTFEHSLGINPSLQTQPQPNQTEDAHFWLEALHVDANSSCAKSYIKQQKMVKIGEAIKHLMKTKDWFKFGINNKILKVEKKSSNSGDRFYLDGIMTKGESVPKFLFSLLEKSKKEILEEVQDLHKIPNNVKRILENGIRGSSTDLEGETRFTINVKRKKNRYSFEIKNKTFDVNGGLIAIKKFQNAVTNNARWSRSWDKLGISSSRDYRYIIYLLTELLGKQKAIEFYKLLKEYSREKDALGSDALKEFIKAHSDKITELKIPESHLQVSINGKLFYVTSPTSGDEIRGKKKYSIYDYDLQNDDTKRPEEKLIEFLKQILDGTIKVSDYGYEI